MTTLYDNDEDWRADGSEPEIDDIATSKLSDDNALAAGADKEASDNDDE